jgi:hypothetical protein
MKDLRPLHNFLGQRTYTLDIVKRAVMADCNPCMTLVDFQVKLADDSWPPIADASQF